MQEKIRPLELDLAQMLKMNNKAMEERLRIQEQRRNLFDELKSTLQKMVKLEKQLKSISASTLSVSSSSSSLGSLSTSSKGSLSSLSFTDIYNSDFFSSELFTQGNSKTVLTASSTESDNVSDDITASCSVATLQKRVEKLLCSNTESDRKFAEKLRSLGDNPEELTTGIQVLSQSTLSLSPRSSLSSLSPPGDPAIPEDTSDMIDLVNVRERLRLIPEVPDGHPLLEEKDIQSVTCTCDPDLNDGNEDDEEGLLPPAMSAAGSDESVAGDSGVYEACSKELHLRQDLDTPQVQITLRSVSNYSFTKFSNFLFTYSSHFHILGCTLLNSFLRAFIILNFLFIFVF